MWLGMLRKPQKHIWIRDNPKFSVDEKVKQLNQHTTSELNDQQISPENIDKHLITKDTPENTINMAYEATFFRGKKFADNCTDAEIDMRKQALSETHQATLNNVINLLNPCSAIKL